MKKIINHKWSDPDIKTIIISNEPNTYPIQVETKAANCNLLYFDKSDIEILAANLDVTLPNSKTIDIAAHNFADSRVTLLHLKNNCVSLDIRGNYVFFTLIDLIALMKFFDVKPPTPLTCHCGRSMDLKVYQPNAQKIEYIHTCICDQK